MQATKGLSPSEKGITHAIATNNRSSTLPMPVKAMTKIFPEGTEEQV